MDFPVCSYYDRKPDFSSGPFIACEIHGPEDLRVEVMNPLTGDACLPDSSIYSFFRSIEQIGGGCCTGRGRGKAIGKIVNLLNQWYAEGRIVQRGNAFVFVDYES